MSQGFLRLDFYVSRMSTLLFLLMIQKEPVHNVMQYIYH